MVTASYDKTARVWDLSALKPRAITLESSLGWVGSANFSPDGQRVVGASYGGAQIWDLSVPERPKLCMRLKQLNAGLLQSASFSPDGGRVVTVSDGGTRVVDLSTPKSPPITLGGVWIERDPPALAPTVSAYSLRPMMGRHGFGTWPVLRPPPSSLVNTLALCSTPTSVVMDAGY